MTILMNQLFETYLHKIRNTAVSEQTEHTSRSALEVLLNDFAAKAGNNRIQVVHEPTRQQGFGAPDFKIKSSGMILGYVEVKAIGTNLDKELKSEQFKKYRVLSDNILVTDYLQWIWLDSKTGKAKARERLIEESDLEGKTLCINPEKAAAVSKIITAFFSEPPQGIGRSQQLALALAARSQLLRDFLSRELQRQSKAGDEGRLHALYAVFRDQVFHDLTVADFADAFAQMLAYGLFLARLNAGENKTVSLENVRSHIPGSFRLIRELVRFLEEMNEPEYEEAKWIVDEVLSIVNGLKLASIQEDLSFRSRKAISRKVRAGDEEEHRLFERDPFIYFYEDYLKAYDSDMRKGRGVYYTPPPVVNFIVRAVDDILKDKFEIADGLADHKRVTVLDFACGTGTFLLEVFERIFENIGGPQAGKADAVVREHILKNLFGFEYLIAPYTIAHLKLSQYLKDKGHELQGDERLQVFLTNTLEPIVAQRDLNYPAISAEVEAAQKVKERDILVIVGNPPYSGHSKNKGKWISAAIDGYKYTIEKRKDLKEGEAEGPEEKVPLGERNPKWLNDDYVKFIRFAQLKMDAVEEGVVGIITNHSWLNNGTFKGMRQSLMRSFDQIFCVDLHGSQKPKENAPAGMENENVFDITKGVSVTLFIKKTGLSKGVWRHDVWGKRLTKYQVSAERSMSTIRWTECNPASPDYFFTAVDAGLREEYARYPVITEIFSQHSLGIVTARDDFCVDFDRSKVLPKLVDFVARDVSDARAFYALGKDARDWRVIWAQNDINESGLTDEKIKQLDYRPFDARWTYYTGKSRGFHCYPRDEVMRLMRPNNVALAVCRFSARDWRHAFVTSSVADNCFVSDESKERGYVFPLYSENNSENIGSTFRNTVDKKFKHHYSPEEVLGYVYAILFCPTYREYYAEFLRTGFPRIPFVDTKAQFDELSKLGDGLVNAHLLRKQKRGKLAVYQGKGEHVVEAVRYSPEEQAIHINKTRHFAPVPADVWNFHIGGYQVIDKYLKSRKGRPLILDEINHVGAIADSLAFTIAQMEKIDEAYKRAFPAQVSV